MTRLNRPFGAHASIFSVNSASASIFLIGPMGAGKTAIGRRLADALQRPFIDADRELEQRTGAAISLIFELEGEQGFRERESALIDELTQRQGIILATGGGVVLNAENRRYLRERGLVIYLRTSVQLQLKRLAKDRQRPLLQHPDREQRLLHMAEIRNPLYRECADIIVESANLHVSAMTRHVLQAMKQHRQPDRLNNNDETSSSRAG
ncbi:MAG: shikimate kinase AroK [Wenzhouxiangellaceae bacterium]